MLGKRKKGGHILLNLDVRSARRLVSKGVVGLKLSTYHLMGGQSNTPYCTEIIGKGQVPHQKKRGKKRLIFLR